MPFYGGKWTNTLYRPNYHARGRNWKLSPNRRFKNIDDFHRNEFLKTYNTHPQHRETRDRYEDSQLSREEFHRHWRDFREREGPYTLNEEKFSFRSHVTRNRPTPSWRERCYDKGAPLRNVDDFDLSPRPRQDSIERKSLSRSDRPGCSDEIFTDHQEQPQEFDSVRQNLYKEEPDPRVENSSTGLRGNGFKWRGKQKLWSLRSQSTFGGWKWGRAGANRLNSQPYKPLTCKEKTSPRRSRSTEKFSSSLSSKTATPPHSRRSSKSKSPGRSSASRCSVDKSVTPSLPAPSLTEGELTTENEEHSSKKSLKRTNKKSLSRKLSAKTKAKVKRNIKKIRAGSRVNSSPESVRSKKINETTENATVTTLEKCEHFVSEKTTKSPNLTPTMSPDTHRSTCMELQPEGTSSMSEGNNFEEIGVEKEDNSILSSPSSSDNLNESLSSLKRLKSSNGNDNLASVTNDESIKKEKLNKEYRKFEEMMGIYEAVGNSEKKRERNTTNDREKNMEQDSERNVMESSECEDFDRGEEVQEELGKNGNFVGKISHKDDLAAGREEETAATMLLNDTDTERSKEAQNPQRNEREINSGGNDNKANRENNENEPQVTGSDDERSTKNPRKSEMDVKRHNDKRDKERCRKNSGMERIRSEMYKETDDGTVDAEKCNCEMDGKTNWRARNDYIEDENKERMREDDIKKIDGRESTDEKGNSKVNMKLKITENNLNDRHMNKVGQRSNDYIEDEDIERMKEDDIKRTVRGESTVDRQNSKSEEKHTMSEKEVHVNEIGQRRNDYETLHGGRHRSSQSLSSKKGGKKLRVRRKTTPLRSESHEEVNKVSMNKCQNPETSTLIQPSKLESELETDVSRKGHKAAKRTLFTPVSVQRQTTSEPRDNPTSQQEPEMVMGRNRTEVPSILELDRTTQMWTHIEKNRNQGMLIGLSIQSLSQTDLNSLIPHCSDVATDMEVYIHSTYIDHRIVKNGSIFLSLYHHLDFMKIFDILTQVELESIYITVGLKRLEICPPVDIVMNLNMKHCNTARSRWRYDMNSDATHEIGLIDVPGGVPLNTLLALFPKAFVVFSSSERVDYSFQLDNFTPSNDVTEEGCELRICFSGTEGIEQFPRLYHRIIINGQQVRISYSGRFRYRLPCHSPVKDVPLCLPAGLEFGERDTLMGSPFLSLKYPAVAATRLVEQIRLKREREKQFRRENLDFKEFSPNYETNKHYYDQKSKEKIVTEMFDTETYDSSVLSFNSDKNLCDGRILKRSTSSFDSDPKMDDLRQDERAALKKRNVNPKTKSKFSLRTGKSNVTSGLESEEDQAKIDTANFCQPSGISKASNVCDAASKESRSNTNNSDCLTYKEGCSVKTSLTSLRKHSDNSSQTVDENGRKQNNISTENTEDFDKKHEEVTESETDMDLSSDSERLEFRSKSKEKDRSCLNVVQFNKESERKESERLSDKDIDVSNSFSHSQTPPEDLLLDWNKGNSNMKSSHSSYTKSEISVKGKSKRPIVPKSQIEEINKPEEEMIAQEIFYSDSSDNYKTCNKKSGTHVGKTSEKHKTQQPCESVIKCDASEEEVSSAYDATKERLKTDQDNNASTVTDLECQDKYIMGRESCRKTKPQTNDTHIKNTVRQKRDNGVISPSCGNIPSCQSVDVYDVSELKETKTRYHGIQDKNADKLSSEIHSRIDNEGRDEMKEENEDMGAGSSDSNKGQITISVTSDVSQKNSYGFVQAVNDQERQKKEQFPAGSNYDNGNSGNKNLLQKDKTTHTQVIVKGNNVKQVGEESRNLDNSSSKLVKKVNDNNNNNKTTKKSVVHHGQKNFMMEEEEKKEDVSSGICKDNYEDVKEFSLDQEKGIRGQRVKERQPDNEPVPSQHILHCDENQISSQMAGKVQTNEKCSRLETDLILNKPDSPGQGQNKDYDRNMLKTISKSEDVLDKFDPSNQSLPALSETVGGSNACSLDANFSSQVKTEIFPKRKSEINELSQVKYPKTRNSSIPETQNSDSGLSSFTPKIETVQVTEAVKCDGLPLRANNIVYFDHVKNEKKPAPLDTSPGKQPAQKDLSESVNTKTMKVFKIESLPLSSPQKSQQGQRSLSTDNEPHYPISTHISPCHRPNLNKLHQDFPQQKFPLSGHGTYGSMTGTSSSREINTMGNAGGQMSTTAKHQSRDNLHSNCNPSFSSPMKMDMLSNNQWLQTDIPPCRPGMSTDRLCVKKEEKDSLSQFQILKQSLVAYNSSASSDSDDLDSCMDDMDPSERLKKNLSSLKSLKRVKKSSSRSPKGSRFQNKVMKALARNFGLSDSSPIPPSVLDSFESKNL